MIYKLKLRLNYDIFGHIKEFQSALKADCSKLPNINSISGLIFYTPLSSYTGTSETNQTLSKSGTVTLSIINSVPCLYFLNSWIYTRDIFLQENQNYSISLWVNNQTTSYPNDEIGFCSLSSSDIKKRITFSQYEIDGIHFYADGIGSGGSRSLITDAHMINGNWYHLVGIINVSTKEISFYKNGSLVGKKKYDNLNAGTGYSGTTGFVIGNLCSWVGYEGQFACKAYITSPRIYNRVLSLTEIKALYKEFKPSN